MNAALIVMTILGCNDAGTDCHYIATEEQRWPTVALCDSVSEQHLPSYANQPYPVLIAVCQNPDEVAAATVVPQSRPAAPAATDTTNSAAAQIAPQIAPEAPAGGDQAQTPVSEDEKETLADRAIQRVKMVLPTTEGVKTVMTKPVRLVEDGYSWVARRFQR
ncbi:MAG: hypothetical protein PW791_10440 [Neorhizobium sp.]|nr:hypothetical protein [Neorhizobium sp.]